MKMLIMISVVFVELVLSSHAGPVRAQAASSSENDVLTSLQIKKLNLEIRDLESRSTTWSKATVQILPPLTTLLAVVGLLLTVSKDRKDRQQSQIIKDEDHIREDLDQLLTFTPEKTQSIGRISFLLDDLNNLVKRNPRRRQAVSNAINEFIPDGDLNIRSHLDLDSKAMVMWQDYRDHLISQSHVNSFLINKYLHAFKNLHAENSNYFESLVWSGNGYRASSTDESRQTRFLALLDGFKQHLELENDEGQKKAIEDFTYALQNPTLTEQLFGRAR